MSWIKNAGGDVHLGFALLTAAGVFFWLQSWIIAVTLVCAGVACMLPAVLIGIRFKMLTEINGEEGIQLPNESLGVTDEAFKELYNHEHATGRSKQSRYGLSDFFWYGHCPSSFVLLLSPLGRYLLAPAQAIHQEHLESADVRYKITAAVTRKLCACPEARLQDIADRHAAALFSEKGLGQQTWEAGRLWGNWTSGWLMGSARHMFFPMFQRYGPPPIGAELTAAWCMQDDLRAGVSRGAS